MFRGRDKRKRLINNIKSKTLHIRFMGSEEEVTNINLKTKLIDDLKIEDRILAFLKIPNYTVQLELQYRMKIHQIVQRLNPNTFSPLWRLFKAKSNEEAEDALARDLQEYQQASLPRRHYHHSINSYFVAFENIQTCEQLTDEFETNKALFSILPSFGYGDVDESSASKLKMIVKWAQQPNDIMWINMGPPQSIQLLKYILFNMMSVALLIISLAVIVLSSSHNILQLPKALAPLLLVILNSTLRFLISKATQWENKLFQYELQMKEFKVLAIYFLINVIIGSLVRNTLNLLDILQSGWGWLELFGLVYRKTDGYFFYLFIINETALSIFSIMVKPGDLFLDVFETGLFYEKNTLLKHKSKYGTNDPFRFGYLYATDCIALSIILLFSASNPLMHFFGVIYFMAKFWISGFQFVVYHKYEETCSNFRMIEKVIEFIQFVIIGWIFLTATTMMFQKDYSNVLILYLSLGAIIYLMVHQKKSNLLKDYATDEEVRGSDITEVVNSWKREYIQSMEPNFQV